MKNSNDFLVPQFYRRLKRGPQVILPKDIGIIMSYTSINKNSVCVDAGTGSGWLAVSLALVAKQVTSYDIRDDFLKIAEKNRELLKLDNLTLKKGDVMKRISEKNVDIVTLDLPDSDKVVRNAHRALKTGGHVVGYLPHMEQVKLFVSALNRLKFENVLVMEVIARDILVREQGVRPSTKGVWHTGYLAFGTKA